MTLKLENSFRGKKTENPLRAFGESVSSLMNFLDEDTMTNHQYGLLFLGMGIGM